MRGKRILTNGWRCCPDCNSELQCCPFVLIIYALMSYILLVESYFTVHSLLAFVSLACLLYFLPLLINKSAILCIILQWGSSFQENACSCFNTFPDKEFLINCQHICSSVWWWLTIVKLLVRCVGGFCVEAPLVKSLHRNYLSCFTLALDVNT